MPGIMLFFDILKLTMINLVSFLFNRVKLLQKWSTPKSYKYLYNKLFTSKHILQGLSEDNNAWSKPGETAFN